jgi:hypothetical protein
MSRRDTHHQAVVHALQKDQWIVTDDPLTLDFAGRLIGIDLAAEKLLAAQRNELQIAVEIKSFQGSSDVSEFHTAVGQFLNYRHVIGKVMPQRALYLAIPAETYAGFFQEPDIQEIVLTHQIKLLVYDPHIEDVYQWID